MKVSEAVKIWMEYHKSNSKQNTINTYQTILSKFCQEFGEKELDQVTTDEILSFLNKHTANRKPQTKKTRYSHLTALFNFVRTNIDQQLQNPCDTPMMKKIFRAKSNVDWNIIEKETVDEIIFRTEAPRDRLILELMARGAMRIGEVLKLTPNDINDRKLTLRDPKSGKDLEYVFIPQKVADRLKFYIREKGIQPDQRVFPICYEVAREMVKKAGKLVGIHLRPHDLRRHSATFASRSGVPIEVVSKVILRHQNLSTTQMYLGKITDVEAIRWIDNLYA